MRVVVLTGIDGTGKTTLARSVRRHLVDQGFDAVCIYGRTYPVVSRAVMFLGRFLLLRGTDPSSDYVKYSRQKDELTPRRSLRVIFVASILLDASVGLCFKLLPSIFAPSRIVVADRYVYDTVISDIAAHLRFSDRQVDSMIERALRWFPRPTAAFVLDAPEEVALLRKADTPHLEYLRTRRRYYLSLANRPEVTILDATQEIEMLLAQIDAKLKDQGLVTS